MTPMTTGMFNIYVTTNSAERKNKLRESKTKSERKKTKRNPFLCIKSRHQSGRPLIPLPAATHIPPLGDGRRRHLHVLRSQITSAPIDIRNLRTMSHVSWLWRGRALSPCQPRIACQPEERACCG